jgi:hypothetical protein
MRFDVLSNMDRNGTNSGAIASEERSTPSESLSDVRSVIGPDGSPLRMTDLPPPGMKRWTARHKAQIVIAVRCGLISLEEACGDYKLTVDELFAWRESYDRHGLRGLSSIRLHLYRSAQRRGSW